MIKEERARQSFVRIATQLPPLIRTIAFNFSVALSIAALFATRPNYLGLGVMFANRGFNPHFQLFFGLMAGPAFSSAN